jgi:hypothetical protein
MPYGISPSTECFIPLPSGNFFVFPSATAEPDGPSYVRVVNSTGGEVAYWSVNEWAESPVEVMGAICGAMLSPATEDDGLYYQFESDCEFPEGIDFEPYETLKE